MACRKAADRAMMELSGWMEKQRDEADNAMGEFVAQQKRVWTPSEVLDGCCVKWLADGWAGDSINAASRGVNHPRSGCSGGCGKDHPRIVLDWRSQPRAQGQQQQQQQQYSSSSGGYAVATLTHELDPFLRYFDKLCHDGLASKEEQNNKNNRCSYRLVGFLQPHLDRLEATTADFGSHLVKVLSPETALSASRRAHQRQIDREERDAKRRRRKKNDAANPNNHDYLLERALTICGCNQGLLLEHLDLAEIAWMRLCGSPIMASVAATMARTRLQQIQLSYSVLVDGMVRFRNRSSGADNNNEGDEDGCIVVPEDAVGDNGSFRKVEMYTVRASRLPLSNNNVSSASSSAATTTTTTTATSPGRFVPKERGNNEFQWGSVPLCLDDAPPPDRFRQEDYDLDYRGHIIRVYLEGSHPDGGGGCGGKPPEMDCLFSKQLEVARFRIDPRGLEVGVHKTPRFTYEVMSSEGRIIPSTSSSTTATTQHPSYNHNNSNRRTIQYSGRFRVKEIKFDFGDLLGVYVRKKLPREKLKLQEIRNRRPVSRIEKEYVKALAKAARDAPGSATAFRGMIGW